MSLIGFPHAALVCLTLMKRKNTDHSVCRFMLIDPNRSHLHRLFSERLNSSFFFLSHMFFSFFFCAVTNSVSVSVLSCEAVSAGRWSSAWKPCTRQTHTVCYQRKHTMTLPTEKDGITCRNWMGSSVSVSRSIWSSLLLSSSTSRCSRPSRQSVQSTPAFSASPTFSVISEHILSTEWTYKRICSAHSRSKSSHASHAAPLKENTKHFSLSWPYSSSHHFTN